MKILVRCAALALLLAPAIGKAQDFDAGMAAHKAGDYATALRDWAPLAEQGDALAQLGLGDIYANGEGGRHDRAIAYGSRE